MLAIAKSANLVSPSHKLITSVNSINQVGNALKKFLTIKPHSLKIWATLRLIFSLLEIFYKQKQLP